MSNLTTGRPTALPGEHALQAGAPHGWVRDRALCTPAPDAEADPRAAARDYFVRGDLNRDRRLDEREVTTLFAHGGPPPAVLTAREYIAAGDQDRDQRLSLRELVRMFVLRIPSIG